MITAENRVLITQDLELGNKFCNWVQVPSSGYKSLVNKNTKIHQSIMF